MVQITPTNTKRIEYIDALRGFAMFLVVFVHVAKSSFGFSLYSSYRYILQVMMPMFFLVSGLVLYREGVVWNFSYIKSFFGKKISVLLVCPLIFLIVYLHVKGIGIMDGIFDNAKRGYWFTFVLFEYYVFYAIVKFFIRNRWADVVLVLLGLVLYPCSWPPVEQMLPIPGYILGFFSFQQWHYFIYFVLGVLLRKHYTVVQEWLDGKWLLPFCIVFFFLINAFSDSIPIYSELLDIPLSIAGLVVLFSFFRLKKHLFSKDHSIGSIFQYTGRHTLDIYLIHYFLIPVNLSRVVTVFQDYPMPIIHSFFVFLVALLIVAVCLLIGNIIRLSPFLAHWLFGAKYV